jgi:hypothetical protein
MKNFYDAEFVLPGSELSEQARRKVLAQFVHRFTRDHIPDWATRDVPEKFGKRYPVQFASDSEWLEKTRFAVKKGGTLDERCHECQSNPTWPDNPEFRKGAE